MRVGKELLRADRNNFNAVRLFLATSVIFSHSFVLNGTGSDPTVPLLGVPVSNLSVDAFFALSGFLVTRSMENKSPQAFLAARLRRLLPGFLVMLALTVFVLGPLVTTLPLAAYFGASETWSYFVANASLLLTRYELPGVFETLPHSGAVNGSLWTLRYELYCYVGLVLLAGSGLLNVVRMVRLLPAAFLCALLIAALPAGDGFIGSLMQQGPRLALAFLCGSAAYLFREHIVLSWRLIAAIGAAYLAIEAVSDAWLLKPVLVTFGVLGLGMLTARNRAVFANIPDYSYGMYIYAFPVQQLLVLGLGPINPYLHMALSVMMTLPLAALSWHCVEAPVLNRWRARPAAKGAFVPAVAQFDVTPEPAQRGLIAAGFPIATDPAGTSSRTSAPGMTMQSSPTFTPGSRIARGPM